MVIEWNEVLLGKQMLFIWSEFIQKLFQPPSLGTDMMSDAAVCCMHMKQHGNMSEVEHSLIQARATVNVATQLLDKDDELKD